MSLPKWKDAKEQWNDALYLKTTCVNPDDMETIYSLLARAAAMVDFLFREHELGDYDHGRISKSLAHTGGRIRTLAHGKRKRGELG